MLDFAYRDLRETALRVLWVAEQQREGFAFAGEHGLDSSSLRNGTSKAYRGRRDPDTIDLLMFHITGPSKGFGVVAYQRYRYRRPELIPEPFRNQLEAIGVPERDWSHYTALSDRYRSGTPYHQIGSQSGYLFANKDLSLWTIHGQGTTRSGGNQGMACAFDCGMRTELTDFLVRTFQATVRALWLRWLAHKRNAAIAVGASPDQVFPLRCVMHSQAKYPGRANDPPAELIRKVIVPVIDTTPGMYLDLDWTYGTGRPLRGRL